MCRRSYICHGKPNSETIIKKEAEKESLLLFYGLYWTDVFHHKENGTLLKLTGLSTVRFVAAIPFFLSMIQVMQISFKTSMIILFICIVGFFRKWLWKF